jgi:hypothetical protein
VQRYPILQSGLAIVAGLFTLPAWAGECPDADAVNPRNKRSSTHLSVQRWPDNTVYYSLTDASNSARQAFLQAARHIADNSAVRFVERTDQPDYIYLSSSNLRTECASELGSVGGPQALGLSAFCQDKHVVLHETMHALGFEHEHARPDRDRYIQVAPGLQNNCQYRKRPGAIAIGPYDFQSVMHYLPGEPPHQSFSILSPENAVPPDSERETLSVGDIAGLNHLYPRTKNQSAAPYPGDNGLHVTVSKRDLALAPSSSATVTITVHAPLRVHSTRAWSENPGKVTVDKRNEGFNRFSLNIMTQARNRPLARDEDDTTRIFFSFISDGGAVGTTLITVDRVEPEALSDMPRHLVSRYNRQCLAARPSAEAIARRQWPSDEKLAWSRVETKALKVGLEPCDGDNPWQVWTRHASGQISVHAEHCLASSKTGRLTLTPCPRRATPPASQIWNIERRRLVHSASGQSLTHTQGDIPKLAPRWPQDHAWQEWEWF